MICTVEFLALLLILASDGRLDGEVLLIHKKMMRYCGMLQVLPSFCYL
jgi:hypothetical protein